jgi:hypothetical protein
MNAFEPNIVLGTRIPLPHVQLAKRAGVRIVATSFDLSLRPVLHLQGANVAEFFFVVCHKR